MVAKGEKLTNFSFTAERCEALGAIIDAIFDEDCGLFAGELSNKECAKVHACAEDRSI